MKIWIDGDACPKRIKEILFRAAKTRQVMVIMIANHLATIPPSPFIKRIQVDAGFDKADNYIVTHLIAGDLIITADLLLARDAIEKGALVLNPRGMIYSANNIKPLVTLRHFNEALRESGQLRGGLESLSAKEIQQFSNHLDRLIAQS